MSTTLVPVGVREAKNRFSELAAEVNATGETLVVMRNNKPWVTIAPADAKAAQRRRRAEALRTLTQSIEAPTEEPEWDASVSDKELLGEERERRFA
jgi:antitoxin (DNA-binding transcriptional repressor) of toxin-antitoxin stability system